MPAWLSCATAPRLLLCALFSAWAYLMTAMQAWLTALCCVLSCLSLTIPRATPPSQVRAQIMVHTIHSPPHRQCACDLACQQHHYHAGHAFTGLKEGYAWVDPTRGIMLVARGLVPCDSNGQVRERCLCAHWLLACRGVSAENMSLAGIMPKQYQRRRRDAHPHSTATNEQHCVLPLNVQQITCRMPLFLPTPTTCPPCTASVASTPALSPSSGVTTRAMPASSAWTCPCTPASPPAQVRPM